MKTRVPVGGPALHLLHTGIIVALLQGRIVFMGPSPWQSAVMTQPAPFMNMKPTATVKEIKGLKLMEEMTNGSFHLSCHHKKCKLVKKNSS